MRTDKKGVSPVVATVLLIALVLILISIIFLWARGFISEQVEKGGKPITQVCENVKFDVQYGAQEVDGTHVQIVNTGNVPIYSFDAKYIGQGSSETITLDFRIDVGKSLDSGIVPRGTNNPEKVILYPMVLGSVKGKKITKAVTCLENGEVINLQ